MHDQIAKAIQRFDSMLGQWKGPGHVEKLATFAYRWTPPKGPSPALTLDRSVGLTLQAVTHGDEVGGIMTLIEFLKLLSSGLLQPEIPLAFALGNHEASRQNRRFLEADLNRSFGAKDLSTLEAKRALELRPLFEDTAYFLDFHQTIEKSASPFFIFPYAQPGFEFAKACHEEIPIVTHWGKPFSLDGMCTDEYVNFKGGVGITLELGQKGFENYQTSVGLQAALGALKFAQEKLKKEYKEVDRETPLYTWKVIELYEEGMDLKEGLYNFQPVKKGEVLGVHGQGPLTCKEDGWLLFPKYPRDPLLPRPKEIYRVAKRIAPTDLGKPGVVGV